MNTPSAKRPAGDDNGPDEKARVNRPPTKRPRPRSVSSNEHVTQLDLDASPKENQSPSGHDLDRLSYHVRLQDFGDKLQKAANAVFPGVPSSRYKQVDVLLLSWEDEDPELPIALEKRELFDTFAKIYGFYVEEWLIPAESSHNRLQVKILQFLWNSDPNHLKIVYYAGHGKVTGQGKLVWTSHRNSEKQRCPTVKWSGIQNSLEECQSDILILLECRAPDICTSDEGNGAVELIAASASSSTPNSQGNSGIFSFTHVMNAQLKALSELSCFTVGQLYNAIFAEIQGWKLKDPHEKKTPVHLVLSQNHGSPRSICLSKTNQIPEISLAIPDPVESTSSSSREENTTPCPSGNFSQNASAASPTTSLSSPPEYPRLLFSIRISEDVQPTDFSPNLFIDWLKTIPIKTSFIRVEAGFASDSTLVLFSISPTILAYLPSHPAMTLLGTIKSKNMMPPIIPQLPSLRTLSPSTNIQPSNGQQKTGVETKPKMQPPPPPPPRKEEPAPRGGCRYIMLRPETRPMTCACQFFTPSPPDPTSTSKQPQTFCECGHKPCYHLATRNYTVYRQELEALTKKVFVLEADVRRLRGRVSGRGVGEERERVMAGFAGQRIEWVDRGRIQAQNRTVNQHEQGAWNFRGS